MVAVVVLAFAAPATRTCADDAPVAVDAAVVLAADVSRSIDDDEFALERRGYAEAIQSRRLMDAISTGPHGAIALAYVEWASENEGSVNRDTLTFAVILSLIDHPPAAFIKLRADGLPTYANRWQSIVPIRISPYRSARNPAAPSHIATYL
jgi:Protein of unknown function (DUF1194)